MPVEFEVIPDEPEPPPPPPDDGGKHSEKRAMRAALQAQAEVGEGAGQAFSEMLTEKSRTHPQVLECEWEDAMRFFIVDKRYGAVRTLAKRMELFAAWQEGRAGEERKERQAAREVASTAFTALLLEAKLDKGTAFVKAERQLSADPRWQALEPDLREAAYEDAADAMRKLDKQRRAERQAARQARAEAMVALLVEQKLAPDAEWAEVREMGGVVDDARWAAMEDDDEREEAWGAYEQSLVKERKQKAKRDFGALLDEQHAAGVLGLKTKWREAHAVVEEDARFKVLKELSTDAPATTFDRWVDEVRERYVRHAKQAKELAVRCGDALAQGEDLASFRAALARQRGGEAEALGALREELRAVLAEL